MLTLRFETAAEVKELDWLLRRAVNCLEPEKQPSWVDSVLSQTDKVLSQEKQNGVNPQSSSQETLGAVVTSRTAKDWTPW